MTLSNNLSSAVFGALVFFTMQAPNVQPPPQIPPFVVELAKAAGALLATYVFHQVQRRYAKRLQKNEQAVTQAVQKATNVENRVDGELSILHGQLIAVSENLQAVSKARDEAIDKNEDYEEVNAALQAKLDAEAAEKAKLAELLEASNNGLSSLSLHLDEQDKSMNQMQLQLAQNKGAQDLATAIGDMLEARFPITALQDLVKTVDQIRGYAETLNLKTRRTQEIPALKIEGDLPNAT